MVTTGNNLLDRINKISEHLRTNFSAGWESKCKKLSGLFQRIEEGLIPGPADLDFINDCEPNRILGRCQSMSPLGNCRVGMMEWCCHRGDWERGICKCKKYQERV